jgi:hypothetical protein
VYQFPYRRFKTQRGIIDRPYAVVEILGPKRRVVLPMLVDSGADVSSFPKSFGEAIGFTLAAHEELDSLSGIGGRIPAVYRQIKMKIGHIIFSSRIAWMLVDGLPCILGREGPFDRFHIEFRQSEKVTCFRS